MCDILSSDCNQSSDNTAVSWSPVRTQIGHGRRVFKWRKQRQNTPKLVRPPELPRLHQRALGCFLGLLCGRSRSERKVWRTLEGAIDLQEKSLFWPEQSEPNQLQLRKRKQLKSSKKQKVGFSTSLTDHPRAAGDGSYRSRPINMLWFRIDNTKTIELI